MRARRTLKPNGQIIDRLMLKKGWTVASLANKAEDSKGNPMDPRTVWSVLRSQPAFRSTLARIADVLDVSVEEIVDNEAFEEEAPVIPPSTQELVDKLPVQYNSMDGAEMIFIGPGAFLMGDDNLDNNPRHTVTLFGYWIYKNLVTVGMYKKFCQETNRQMPPEPEYPDYHFNPNWSKEDHPIVNVTWNDAKAYCEWAGVRLPTEAEWERAARGIDRRIFPWGNAFDNSKLWCSVSTQRRGTTSVGEYGISPCGCTDMAGNVMQWCADWYDAKFWSSPLANLPHPQNQSLGERESRVLRGSPWDMIGDASIHDLFFRSAYRFWYNPTYWLHNLGFRCAAGPYFTRS
jgi:sulfatase modifying factor 1